MDREEKRKMVRDAGGKVSLFSQWRKGFSMELKRGLDALSFSVLVKTRLSSKLVLKDLFKICSFKFTR